MKTGKYLLAALMVFGLAGMVYAAPVGLTSEADATKAELWADNNVGLNVGFIADFVGERKIDIDSGEFEMNAVIARIGMSVIDKFNFYVDIGQAQNMELTWSHMGEEVRCKYDEEYIWGIGVSLLIYRWDNGLEIGASAGYRTADMTIDKGSYAGTEYSRGVMTKVTDGEFEETQGALELGWKTEYFIPYIGIKFSDVEVDGEFAAAGVNHNALGVNADQNFGIFVGVTFLPKLDTLARSEALAINLEGRFIDEEAFNFGATYKF